MKVNDKGLDLIKRFEGCKLEAYLDPIKIPTIGFGATFYENGTKVKIGDKITKERASELLEWHVSQFAIRVKDLIKVSINDNQFASLVSFAYNCGIGNLKISTLLKKVNANPFDTTIRDEFKKWNRAGGKVLAGLTTRRNAEADLYFSKV